MSFAKIRRATFSRFILIASGVLAGLVGTALACGPFFPNTVLDQRDRTLLQAPVGDFCSEIDRLLPAAARRAPASPFPRDIYSVIQEDNPVRLYEATAAADAADLKKALADAKAPLPRAGELVKRHAAFRSALTEARKAAAREWNAKDRASALATAASKMAVPEGLPAEFNHYEHGAMAFHQDRRDEARREWQTVLDLPKGQRQYRSVWAAFMIGRTLVDADPKAAIDWLKKARGLAKEGFADSLDLATASLGWQGRAELNLANYRGAVDLYLAHYSACGFGSAMSLRDTAAQAFKQGPKVLQALAADPVVRPVLSAYVVARGGMFGDWPKDNAPAHAWLKAIEAAGAADVKGADRLAWAAYQAGDWDAAKRWLRRAPDDSPITQWVSAKMLLRDGKLDKAAEILSRLVKDLPAAKDAGLRIIGEENCEPTINPIPESDVAGELAILRMARRQYSEALDLLMQYDYWTDAAYVAERVLEPDELMAYVDKHWPADLAAQWKPGYAGASGSSGWPVWWTGWWDLESLGISEAQLELFRGMIVEGRRLNNAAAAAIAEKFKFVSRVTKAHDIRWLLARRLVRLGRWKEARPYFAPDLQKKLDTYIQGVRSGANANLSAAQRAAALWQAARMARYWGMELLGTELEPDNAIHGGRFGATPDEERKPAAPPPPDEDTFAPRTTDEKRRADEHVVVPDRRYHYRYVAADHAWAAAQFMPDNSDETAKVLCEAGVWLKGRDPKAADRFYKALVLRCSQTALGREAAETHWFPQTFRPAPAP